MSPNKQRKHSNFIVQGGILAITGIISRIIGLVYRIPLQKTIGDSGMGFYSAAFQIYSIMLIISSYSLPVAVSKLVSARVAKGQYKNAKKLYRGAMLFACVTGGATCLITFFGADAMAASIMNLPKSAIALRVLAPALLVVAVMGVMRGYFQGLGTMLPTASSQLLEQIINAVVSVAAAIYLFEYGTSVAALLKDETFAPAYGAAGGTLGTLAGAVSGLILLIVLFSLNEKTMKRDVKHDRNGCTENFGKVFRVILITVLPVILSSTIYNISDVVDQSIFGNVMSGKGLSEQEIAADWGIFSTKYKVIINVPVALANALCSSMMPSLTTSIEQGNHRNARHKVRIAMRFVMIIAIPCAVGLAVLGEPILTMLFSGEIHTPAMMLRMGSVSVILFSMSTLSNGVLQGIDKMNIPVRNSAIALVIHIGLLYLFIGPLNWGLYGVVAACCSFAFIICALNWLSIGRHLSYHQEILRTFAVPLIAALIMGAITGLSYHFLKNAMSYILATIISIGIAIVVYFITLLLLKGVSESEIRSFPGGDILAAIGKKLHLL